MIKKLLITFITLGTLMIIVYLGVNRWIKNDGPDEVILDKHICRFCRMHVSDLYFSAQIQTETETYFYDDMGCLIKDQELLQNSIKAVYYHHFSENRWIPEDEVAFFQLPDFQISPMGYNLAAISQNDPESIAPLNLRVGLSQAKIQVFNTSMAIRKKRMQKRNNGKSMETNNTIDQ